MGDAGRIVTLLPSVEAFFVVEAKGTVRWRHDSGSVRSTPFFSRSCQAGLRHVHEVEVRSGLPFGRLSLIRMGG